MAAAAFGALASPVRVKLAPRAICGAAQKLRTIGRRVYSDLKHHIFEEDGYYTPHIYVVYQKYWDFYCPGNALKIDK
ncbi:MAG: hypothetical protein HXO54_01430 [Rothia dentocariosa]|nr:hypothetical protein [Rothia dentocariosa]